MLDIPEYDPEESLSKNSQSLHAWVRSLSPEDFEAVEPFLTDIADEIYNRLKRLEART